MLRTHRCPIGLVVAGSDPLEFLEKCWRQGFKGKGNEVWNTSDLTARLAWIHWENLGIHPQDYRRLVNALQISQSINPLMDCPSLLKSLIFCLSGLNSRNGNGLEFKIIQCKLRMKKKELYCNIYISHSENNDNLVSDNEMTSEKRVFQLSFSFSFYSFYLRLFLCFQLNLFRNGSYI